MHPNGDTKEIATEVDNSDGADTFKEVSWSILYCN